MIGQRFKSNRCGWYTVIGSKYHAKGARWLIEFDESFGVKYQMYTEKRRVLSGGVKNPYYPLKLGVACVGGVNSKDYPKEFNKWRGMIERCYNPNHKHYKTYGGAGIVVDERWKCFEYFLADLPLLEGYDEEKIKNGELDLDKDSKGDRKQYCPKSCVFICPTENLEEMHKRLHFRKYVATHLKTGERIIFYNQTEFAISMGYGPKSGGNISMCIKGKQKSFAGYRFELYEEEN